MRLTKPHQFCLGLLFILPAAVQAADGWSKDQDVTRDGEAQPSTLNIWQTLFAYTHQVVAFNIFVMSDNSSLPPGLPNAATLGTSRASAWTQSWTYQDCDEVPLTTFRLTIAHDTFLSASAISIRGIGARSSADTSVTVTSNVAAQAAIAAQFSRNGTVGPMRADPLPAGSPDTAYRVAADFYSNVVDGAATFQNVDASGRTLRTVNVSISLGFQGAGSVDGFGSIPYWEPYLGETTNNSATADCTGETTIRGFTLEKL